MNAKKTALYESHLRLGGQMVLFADTWLPIRYHSEKDEHLAVRHNVGIFDVSHMGEFFIRGNNAARFLQHLLTNDIERLCVKQAQYTLLLNDHAGIIDDLIVYRLEEQRFLLVVNAANIDRDFQHILSASLGMTDVHIEDASQSYSMIAVQGPNALPLLSKLTKDVLPNRFFIDNVNISGIKAMVSRTGYTGEDGFEIFVLNQDAEKLWQTLYDYGQSYGLKPCGLSARDSLRLEAGLLLHGQDMDELTTPKEASLMWAVAMNKAHFIGKEALLTQKALKKLIGFQLLERGIARHGFRILDKNHHEIGVVTSGSFPPEQETAIGFGYVCSEHAGADVLIDIRGRMTKAVLTKSRFLWGVKRDG